MNYYLTHLEIQLYGAVYKVTQLVKASNRQNANSAVEEDAKEEYGNDVVIHSIRVDDLIIGK